MKRKIKKRNRGIRRLSVLLSLLLLLSAGAYVLYGRLFPMDHEEKVTAYAEEYGVDPFLVYAVIHTESRFIEDAVSPAGAIGLMQVTPDTGAFIADRLKMPSFTEEMLKDPDTNIRMGTYYLSYLKENFPRVETQLAAYNAGPNRVAAWLQDEGISDGEILTNIPFEETRNYVERVLQREKIYRILYFYK
ncbi:lytic transglycosylase domain-containing protein [Proteiniclasticum sp. C24MP]|uniref:lytic transglycosylase domain-containing protein n=1 Tax=Proteiniclasticum sp. C24MP TaxID=3374101 RepID=UPI003754A2F8